jgi:hypothetical protein
VKEKETDMKRNRIGLYVGVLCITLLLTACQSADAKEVQQKIASIGEVTEESGPLLEEIQGAYAKLDEKAQKSISNKKVLEQAIQEYDQLCADRVIEQIDAIGEVNANSLSLEQQEKIKDARTAYDALEENQQNIVEFDNGEKLKQAEKSYTNGISSGIEQLVNTEQISQTVTIAEIKLLETLYQNMPESQKETARQEIEKAAKDANENTKKSSTENVSVADVIEKAEIAVTQQSIKKVDYKKGTPTDTQIQDLMTAIDNYVALSKSAQEKIDAKQLTSAIKKYNSYRQEDDAYNVRAQYIQNTEQADYSRLLEYASSYKKNKTQFSFEVEIQSTEKGALFLADTVTAVIQGTEDKLYLKDDRKEKSHTFQAGDTLTVYGVLDEVKTEKTQQEGSGVFGTNILAKTAEKVEVPVVKITYTSMDNVGVLVSNDPDKDESEYVEIEAQRKALDEKIKQMPETK